MRCDTVLIALPPVQCLQNGARFGSVFLCASCMRFSAFCERRLTNAQAGAGASRDGADAPKSQCYTARTIHVVYPQQAGRR